MERFEEGRVINTAEGEPITVVKYLASGGQGDVYLVNYAGKERTLKWYRACAVEYFDDFYDNLKHNVEKGSPDKAFLWPLAITEKIEGSFGCIMDLMPEGYCSLWKVLSDSKYSFTSFKAAIDACILIANAFRMLHNIGCYYPDLNDGQFYVNPQTGDVIITDTDEIVPNGMSVKVMQKPRFAAPEILVGAGKQLPSSQSNRYAISLLIFLILFNGHPLEGKRWLVPCLTDTISKKLYGSEPVFIFDPEDDSNRPVEKIHAVVIRRWKAVPDYLKEMCIKAFSKQALMDPSKRPLELEWLKVLLRFRSSVVRCSCGSDVFVGGLGSYKCDCCGGTIEINKEIQLPTYSIAAVKGARVYRLQLGVCLADEALCPVLLVVAKPDGTLGVKNMTPNPLKAFTPSQKERVVEPGVIIPYIAGISIEAYGKTVSLI